ncbi:hypothetical protein RND81_05G271300 [Saponaria officinalis]|uniref:Uncharacterized protein n=1 Tax=Saponaria officinalis TaxID=3572 RepID=A0AAW1KX69_SAPOF
MSSPYMTSSKSFLPYERTKGAPAYNSRFSIPIMVGSGEEDEVRVHEPISFRQQFVNTAYTFSGEPSNSGKSSNFVSRVKHRVTGVLKRGNKKTNGGQNKATEEVVPKAKKLSGKSLLSMVRGMFGCTSKVLVADA